MMSEKRDKYQPNNYTNIFNIPITERHFYGCLPYGLSQMRLLVFADAIPWSQSQSLDNFYCKLFSGVLITGSVVGNMKSVEIYNPLTKTSCSLPQLPVSSRYQHTQDGELACGGGGSRSAQTSCVKWSPVSGTWTKSHTLRQTRYGHVSWATASGVYLIGGHYSRRTSEKVKEDGSVEEGFSLKYDTK